MTPKSNKVFFSRWIEILLFGAPCVLLIGLFAYVSSGKSVSLGQFELGRRADRQWSYKNGKIAAYSATGTLLRTGENYCLGPFRITRWKGDWKIK